MDEGASGGMKLGSIPLYACIMKRKQCVHGYVCVPDIKVHMMCALEIFPDGSSFEVDSINKQIIIIIIIAMA